jgi:hypothetical protein
MIELLREIEALKRRIAHLETAETGTAWTDYSSSSTIAGWASYTTKDLYYIRIGKRVFVEFYIEGPFNGAAVTFTLPYASKASGTVSAHRTLCRTIDNGTAGVGLLSLPFNSGTVTIYKDVAGSAWTAAGTRGIYGQFSYQCA